MIETEVVKSIDPRVIQGIDSSPVQSEEARPTDISALPVEVLGRVFSFISPAEGNKICRVSKKWKLGWDKYRYQEVLYNFRICKELVDGKTLFECFEEFSLDFGRRDDQDRTSSNASYGSSCAQGGASDRLASAASRVEVEGREHVRSEGMSAEYLQLAKSACKIRSAVQAAMAYLSPEERGEIETIPVDPPPPQKFSWGWFTSYLSLIFGAHEPVRMKREIWQIAENPALLKILFEKAFHNKTLCRFFGWKVECDDNPPWKKVNKIREWLAQPALKMQSYIYLDRGLTRIPPEIGTCINVEAINLSNNQIASLPSQIGTLTKLQSLSLGGNRLTSFLEDCSSLEELRALYLENNLLPTLPEGMSQLNLQTLDISFNPITTFPQVLYSIKSLRFLRLSEEQKTRFRTELANLKKMNSQLRVS